MAKSMALQAKESMSWSSQSKGFTFIELLVTTTLGLLLMTAAAASYQTFGTKQARSDSAREVMSVLRRAHERARSGDKPATGCAQLDGYRVWAQTSTQTYKMSLRCNANGQDSEIQEFSLRGSEYFQNGFDVTFQPQVGPLPNTPATVKIGPLTPGENHYEFLIERNGLITDLGIVND